MSELYDILTETPPTKVVLLALDQGLWDCERSLAELAALCEANHMEAVAQISQKRQTPETGYCIGRKWWNKGFTTEALRAVVAYWFTRTDSRWLACGHAAANPASGRVMEKAGFVYHHNTVYHKFDGTPVECRSYLLTRKAFETA